ncbi:MAG TPA: hypothetical protein VJH20_04425 [Candidatus Nanoarchaeia archaeon]|nr:hypothetical protein [Candidatus Nanoarchaeia archaeon]
MSNRGFWLFFVLLYLAVVIGLTMGSKNDLSLQSSGPSTDSSVNTYKIDEIASKDTFIKEKIITSEVSKSSRIPVENPTWVAAKGKIIPKIDGKVESWEIKDTNMYQQRFYSSPQILGKFYVKYFMDQTSVDKKLNIYMAFKFASKDFSENTLWGLTYFFDEGDEGDYGGGSFDNQLYIDKEDHKIVYRFNSDQYCYNYFRYTQGCPLPQCSPDSVNNCWICKADIIRNQHFSQGSNCVYNPTGERSPSVFGRRWEILDGYFTTINENPAWAAMGILGANNSINFIGMGSETNGEISGEVVIPFEGFDGLSPAESPDISDLFVHQRDIIGFHLHLRYANNQQPYVNLFYPENSSAFDASSFARLQL